VLAQIMCEPLEFGVARLRHLVTSSRGSCKSMRVMWSSLLLAREPLGEWLSLTEWVELICCIDLSRSWI